MKTNKELIDGLSQAGFDADLKKTREIEDELMRRLNQNEWIKCSERMPKTKGMYLVYGLSALNTSPIVESAWWDKKKWQDELLPIIPLTVTYWMPLPKPPG
jgi:hypothetical protein